MMLLINACSSQHVSNISGTISGNNDKIIQRTDVHVSLLGQNGAIKHIKANSKGHFRFQLHKNGLYRLQFTGINHRMKETLLDLRKPADIKLHVRLASNITNHDMKQIFVIGAFNHFSYADAIPMEPQANGTFTATIPVDSSAFVYQIIGPDPNAPVNGTQSDAYAYDGNGGYISILNHVTKQVTITYNPSLIDKKDTVSHIHFIEASPEIRRFANTYNSFMEQENNYWKAYTKFKNEGHDPNTFNYDWTPELQSFSKELKAENNPEIRKLLYIKYLDMGVYGASNLDPDIAKTALNQISATSPLWSIQPLDMIIAIDATGQPTKYNKYLKDAASHHTDPDVRATAIYYQLNNAFHKGDLQNAMSYYKELTQKYSNTTYAQWAKQMFAVNKSVAVGKPVPNFKVTSLTNPKVTFSRKSMLGHYYMIDFWATWCGPCVRSLPGLTRAYEKYKNKNFTILSLSLDDSPKDVIKFHKERFRMPWHNAFLKGAFQNKIAKRFDVTAIPSPILVNKKGIVIAQGLDLRGSNLDMTLAQYLKKD